MVFKRLIVATAAIALSTTPALAAASTARATSAAIVPASESVDGSQLRSDSSIIVLILALIAAGLGGWALLDNNHNRPTSP